MEDNPIELLGVILLFLVIIVGMLALSLVLFPPKFYDPNFTSRALTGWTNTPGKLTWSRTIDKVSESE